MKIDKEGGGDMKRFIQIIAIVLFTFLFSAVYTYAASEDSPLNTYKHPFLSKLNQMEELLDEMEKVIRQDEQEKVRRLKEEKETEITELLEREKAEVIREVMDYQLSLLKQLKVMDSHPGIETMKEYEQEKAAEMELQLNDEIAEHLSDLLIKNNK